MVHVTASILAEMLRESLRQGQTPRLTVSSNSMAPLLRRDDQITLEAVTVGALRIGDIITVASVSQVMTHRFWGVTDDSGQVCLLTRGDRPLVFDAPWPAEALIGRVNGRLRHNRHLSLGAGPGCWLNRQLCRLAQREVDWWGRPQAQRRWLRRGLRGLLYGSALLLTTVIGVFFGKRAHPS